MEKKSQTTKKPSRILKEAHEIAKGLHRMGLIDKQKMRKYDVLCLKPTP